MTVLFKSERVNVEEIKRWEKGKDVVYVLMSGACACGGRDVNIN